MPTGVNKITCPALVVPASKPRSVATYKRPCESDAIPSRPMTACAAPMDMISNRWPVRRAKPVPVPTHRVPSEASCNDSIRAPGESIVCGERLKPAAVVAEQPVLGSHPEESLTILHDHLYGQVLQPLFLAVKLEAVALRPSRVDTDQDNATTATRVLTALLERRIISDQRETLRGIVCLTT